MRDDSVTRFIAKSEKGSVFCISDICTDTSSYNSVKTQLSKACSEGSIIRITRGIYQIPKFSSFLNAYVPCGTLDVVHTISRMNGWRIIPSGNACLNYIGLSTQVPAKTIFYSDGPNHKYTINGITIEFKHRSPRNFPPSDRSAIIVQAIKARGKNNCDKDFIRGLSHYIHKEGVGNLIEETRHSTTWIHDIISEACVQ